MSARIGAELGDHFMGAARRHPATDIDHTPHGFVTSATVRAAIDELIDDLTAVAGNPDAKRAGADTVAGATIGGLAALAGVGVANAQSAPEVTDAATRMLAAMKPATTSALAAPAKKPGPARR